MGFGSMALGPMAARSLQAATNPLSVREPHFPATAKRVIHIFANGGPSQVDTFDYKPELARMNGQTLSEGNLKTERKTGAIMQSPFGFKQYGQSGKWVSDLFPNVAQHVDKMCFMHSLTANLPNHEPSLALMNTGAERIAVDRPSLGSWVTYGLGSENENLPGFVSLCAKGLPVAHKRNWRSAFLPGAMQGVHVDLAKAKSSSQVIENLDNLATGSGMQRSQLDLVRSLNATAGLGDGVDSLFDAQVQSMELAYRMQMEATDAFDVSLEDERTRELYGKNLFGDQMLVARRLVERGVRFVQVWHGGGQPWDAHTNIEKNHGRTAQESDQPIAALLTDLEQRGLLDDTLVLWGGEFGRTPTVELPNNTNGGGALGRDHNHYGFTMWMAGGGAKQGYSYGSTDELGFQAQDDKMHVHDLHATILHMLGFDHEKLTYRYSGRDFRLTDVHGEVIKDLLA